MEIHDHHKYEWMEIFFKSHCFYIKFEVPNIYFEIGCFSFHKMIQLILFLKF